MSKLLESNFKHSNVLSHIMCLKFFIVLACITVTILRVSEVGGGCDLMCRSVNGGKGGSVEFDGIRWKPCFMLDWLWASVSPDTCCSSASYLALTISFHILSNLVSTNHTIIWCYTVWTIENILKKKYK
jgi:hypothetical protein